MKCEQNTNLTRGMRAAIKREAMRTAKELPYLIFTKEHAEAISKLDNQTAGKVVMALCHWIFDGSAPPPEDLSESESELLEVMKHVQTVYFKEWQAIRSKLPKEERLIHLSEINAFLKNKRDRFRIVGNGGAK